MRFNKLFIIIFVITLFSVIGCVQEYSDEELESALNNLSDEELENILEESGVENDKAITGKAHNKLIQVGRSQFPAARVFDTAKEEKKRRVSKPEPLGPITTDDINVKDYGAKGNGITDDTIAIQNAINAAASSTTAVYFPRGTYLVSSTLQADLNSFSHVKALRISGDNAILKAVNNMEAVMSINRVAHFTMEGLTFDGNNLALYGLKLWRIVLPSSIIRDITVKNAISHGLYLNETQLATFDNAASSNNGGAGFYCVDCNGAWFEETTAFNNGDSGYIFESDCCSGFVYMDSPISKGNQKHGIFFTSHGQGGGIINHAWVEGNYKDGIRIDTFNAVVTDSIIKGTGTGDNKAIRITKAYPFYGGSRIFNNHISGNGDLSFQEIQDESPSPSPQDANNIVQNNFFGSVNGPKPVPKKGIIDSPYRTIINVKDFGAIGNDNIDDTIALQNAINQGVSANTEVYLPRGEYLISAPLQINKDLKITGEWALIKASTNMKVMVEINSVSNFEMERIVLLGNNLAANGVHILNVIGNNDVVFSQVKVQDAKADGFIIKDSSGIIVKNSRSSFNGGSGFSCSKCNKVIFKEISSTSNKGDGMLIVSGSNVKLDGLDVEVNDGNGVVIKSEKTILSDTWVEGNKLDGITVEGNNNVIVDSRIITHGLNTKAIRIKLGFGNKISLNNLAGLTIETRTIKDESNQANDLDFNVYSYASAHRNLYLIQDQINPCPAYTVCIEK